MFDRAALVARMMGKESLVQRMVGQFLTSSAQQVEELRQAAQAGDLDRVHEVAHGYKGSVANFGAEPLVAVAQQLEEAADLAQVTALMPQFEQLHAQLVGLMQA